MSTEIVKLPFGNGFAIITGEFTPEEPITEFCTGENAEFIIEKFVVGGVDIIDELYDLVAGDGSMTYLDYFITKHWEEILKQCVDEEM